MKKRFGLALLTAVIICGQAWAQTPDTAWVRAYNGPAGGDDQGVGCAADGSGCLYVSGLSFNGSNYDYLTVKYNAATGDTLWTRRYNGPTNGNDAGMYCAVDTLGFLYVTGSSYDGVNEDDYLTIKYDAATGDTIWTKRHGALGDTSNKGAGCSVDNMGSLFVTGTSNDGFQDDYLTIKYNAVTGDTLWTRRYNGLAGGDDQANGCAADHWGNLYVAGYSFNGTDYNLMTVKYAPDGETLWTRRSAATVDFLNHQMASCAADSSGNVYVTGMCGITAGDQNRYCVTSKYSPLGDSLWTSIYDGPTMYDESMGCTVAPSNDYLYVTGTTHTGGPHDRFLTICYNPANGDTIWSRSYLSSLSRTEYSVGCAVDAEGNLYVSGMSMDSLTWIGDYQTIRYNTAAGVAGEPSERAQGTAVKFLPNTPNPFSHNTTVSYQLDRAGRVSLSVYNLAGQRVKTLVNAGQSAGAHTIDWNGQDEHGNQVCAGMYFARLQAGDQKDTRKLILVK